MHDLKLEPDSDSLTLEPKDSHDPYMRIPSERNHAPGQKTDLRRLSAWIKLLGELEGAKKLRNE
jgi:hypothetical protein